MALEESGMGDKKKANNTADPNALVVAANGKALTSLGAVGLKVKVKDIRYDFFEGSWGQIKSISWCPDNRFLVTGSDDCYVRVFDVISGHCHRIFRVSSQVSAVQISPDGRFLAIGGTNHPVCLLELSSGHFIRLFEGDKSNQNKSISFSPDGNFLATATYPWDGALRLWEVSTGRCIRVYKDIRVSNVSFSPGGRFFATGSQYVRLWDVTTERLIRDFAVNMWGVQHKEVCFSPDGQFLASAEGAPWHGNDNALLWEVSSGRCVKVFNGHTRPILSINLNGRFLATGSMDQSAMIWDSLSGRCVKILAGNGSWVSSVRFSPDGQFLATAHGNILRLWEMPSVRFIRELGGSSLTAAFSFSPKDSIFYTLNDNDTAQLWSLSSGRPVRSFAEPTTSTYSSFRFDSHFSPKGRFFVTCGSNYTARLYEVASGKCINVFVGHEKFITAVAFSPDESFLVTGDGGGAIRLWQVSSTGRCIRVFTINGGFSSLCFCPDGRFVAIQTGNYIHFWDISTGQSINGFPGSGYITSASFSPDGRFMATGNSEKLGAVCLVEVSSGRSVKFFEGHTKSVNSFSFSPLTGRFLATGSDDFTSRLFEVESGICLHIFEGHKDKIMATYFSPNDERLLVTTSADMTSRWWNVSTGNHLATLHHLKKGFLWATPPDKGAPSGWLWTDRPELICVYKCFIHNNGEEYAIEDLPAGHSDRKKHLDVYNDQRMVMNRINNPEKYQADIRKITGKSAEAAINSRLRHNPILLPEGGDQP
jgi:WD40 repeat protein